MQIKENEKIEKLVLRTLMLPASHGPNIKPLIQGYDITLPSRMELLIHHCCDHHSNVVVSDCVESFKCE